MYKFYRPVLEACPLTKSELQSMDFVINDIFNEIIQNK